MGRRPRTVRLAALLLALLVVTLGAVWALHWAGVPSHYAGVGGVYALAFGVPAAFSRARR